LRNRRRRGKLHGASLNKQGLAADKGIGNLAAGGFEDASEGLTGYIHLLSGLLVIEPLLIGQADGFPFIFGQNDLFEQGAGNPLRFIHPANRQAADTPAIRRTRHNRFS
jgi:hypothetical protein